MVKGIDIFKKYFSDFKEQYVLIGGAACDLLFNETASDFRATKDLDLVLIIEALTPEFGLHFWTFIKDGQYQNRARSNGAPQFYRFVKPKAWLDLSERKARGQHVDERDIKKHRNDIIRLTTILT